MLEKYPKNDIYITTRSMAADAVCGFEKKKYQQKLMKCTLKENPLVSFFLLEEYCMLGQEKINQKKNRMNFEAKHEC